MPRAAAEWEIFTNLRPPPIYGYLAQDPDGCFSAHGLFFYGTVAAKIKRSVHRRVTYTFGQCASLNVAPVPFLRPALYAADFRRGDTISGLATVDDWGRGAEFDRWLGGEKQVADGWVFKVLLYGPQSEEAIRATDTDWTDVLARLPKITETMASMEAHIFGGLSLQEVEELIMIRPPTSGLRFMLEESGIPWRALEDVPTSTTRDGPMAVAVPSLKRLLLAVESGSSSKDSRAYGEAHWRWVAWAGHRLCLETPTANPIVVFLFGLLHDSQRLNDAHDPEHGRRAADFAGHLAEAGFFHLSTDDLRTLRTACSLHSDGRTTDDPTIGVCWDADRLNLWRGGIRPDPELLSTRAAKDPERIKWALALGMDEIEWETILAAYSEPTSARILVGAGSAA